MYFYYPIEPPAACPRSKAAAEAAAAAAAPAAVCPVKHTAPAADAVPAAPAAAVCPVKHSSVPVTTPATDAAVCPVRTRAAAAVAGTHGSDALLANANSAEPGDTADRFVRAVGAKARSAANASTEDLSKIAHADEVPGGRIPATGRGNSQDGADWVNPTPKELFRALRRKDKHIDEEDAFSVAFVHSVVVDQTWDQIMAYEALHADECSDPTLNRFEGKYGDHTIKTKLTHWLYPSVECFDRHDWYVNRCGREVRYIIDYYSTRSAPTTATVTGPDGKPVTVEVPAAEEEYFIDARPAPTVGGMVDRARMAWKRWRNGEQVW